MTSKFWGVILITCFFCLGWGQSVSANLEDAATRGIQLYWEQQDEDALVFLNQALALDPGNIEALVYRGAVSLFNHDYEEAEVFFETALALDPDSALAHSFRAMLWAWKDLNYERALDEARRAVDLAPSDPVTHYNLGVILSEMDNDTAADDAFLRGIAVDTGEYAALTARLYLYHSRLYWTTDPDYALDTLNTALELWPDGIPVLLERANVLMYTTVSDYERAADDINRILKLDADNTDALLLRGELSISQGEYGDAIAAASHVLTLDPESVQALAVRGRAYGWAGKPELGLIDLETAYEKLPNSAYILISRSVVYMDLERFDEALQDLERAIALEPDNAFALMYRGDYYRTTEQYDLALEDLTRAAMIPGSDRVFIWSTRAEVYRQMGAYDLALEDLNHALGMKPDHSSALALRGAVYTEIGLYDLAIKDLEAALEINPWDSFARDTLQYAEEMKADQEDD